MKVITGTVINGKIEVPAEALGEGTRVVVMAVEPAELVRLTPEDEQELLAAAEEIRRGEFVDGYDLLARLRSKRQR